MPLYWKKSYLNVPLNEKGIAEHEDCDSKLDNVFQ